MKIRVNHIKSNSRLFFKLIFKTPLKYFLLFLVTFTLVSIYGDKRWIDVFRQGLSSLFSIAIFILIVREVWSRRSQLRFIYKIYLCSGILPYLRALFVVVITITLGSIIYTSVPDFLRWGWGNLVFGNPANLALQPIDTAYQASQKVNELQGNSFDAGWLFLFPVWLLLILVLPFWAEIEEKIFRKGVHSWKKIAINSLNFGLIHLTMGIPICWAMTLALPGFIFACRYKYVYHRHLKKFHDDEKAQEAGVEASTADHAIYNAILISLSVAVVLLVK